MEYITIQFFIQICGFNKLIKVETNNNKKQY